MFGVVCWVMFGTIFWMLFKVALTQLALGFEVCFVSSQVKLCIILDSEQIVFIIALRGSVGLVIMIWQRINTMKAVRKRIKNQFIIKLK